MSSLSPSPHASKAAVLDAALRVIRTRGYTATTLDDLCAAAGVSKGSFFHDFPGKEDMTLAAHRALEPRHRRGLRARSVPEEEGPARPRPRLHRLSQRAAACDAGISTHARTVARDIAAAKALHAPDAHWDPEALALFTQAALQGAFVIAKARGNAAVAGACIDHLRQHIAHLPGAKARPGSRKEFGP